MNNNIDLPVYSKEEERLNIISHGIGSILSVIALYMICIKAGKTGDVRFILSSLVFGFSMVELYTMSFIYHATKDPKVRIKTQKGDHLSINILIFGSNFIFLFGGLHSRMGNWFGAIVAVLSIISTILNFINVNRFRATSMVIYIVTGWASIIVIKYLYVSLGLTGIILLIIGGLFYTFGIIFYAIKRKYMHAIWHVFVLIGTIFHFLTRYLYVIPKI